MGFCCGVLAGGKWCFQHKNARPYATSQAADAGARDTCEVVSFEAAY